jgi:hypothetical protein
LDNADFTVKLTDPRLEASCFGAHLTHLPSYRESARQITLDRRNALVDPRELLAGSRLMLGPLRGLHCAKEPRSMLTVVEKAGAGFGYVTGRHRRLMDSRELVELVCTAG